MKLGTQERGSTNPEMQKSPKQAPHGNAERKRKSKNVGMQNVKVLEECAPSSVYNIFFYSQIALMLYFKNIM